MHHVWQVEGGLCHAESGTSTFPTNQQSSGSVLSSRAPVTSVLTRIHPHAPAILIMVTALSLAATGGARMKQQAGELPPVLLAWFRFSIYVVILIPLAFWRAGRACLRPSRPVVQVVRGLLLAAGKQGSVRDSAHPPGECGRST